MVLVQFLSKNLMKSLYNELTQITVIWDICHMEAQLCTETIKPFHIGPQVSRLYLKKNTFLISSLDGFPAICSVKYRLSSAGVNFKIPPSNKYI